MKQPPHNTSAARVRSVRGARRVSHKHDTVRMSTAGMSHEIWPPMEERKRRSRPVGPPMEPATRPPPTLPDSFPDSRPSPLYPKIKFNRLLFCDPPI